MMIEKQLIKSIILSILVLSLLITLSVNYARLFEVIIAISGIIIGRVVYLEQPTNYKKSKKSLFPLVSSVLILMIIFTSPFSKFFALLLFLLSGVASYYLHHKMLVGNFKNKNFIK